MNDPHVESLRYRILVEPPHSIVNAVPPPDHCLGSFNIQIKNGLLEAKPTKHFATAAEARAQLDPHLASWEEAALLSPGRIRMAFHFERETLIDRAPQPGCVVTPESAECRMRAGRAEVRIELSSYPEQDPAYRGSELTSRLCARLREHIEKNGRLCDLGNSVLTALEERFGGRPELANALGIDLELLNVLGDLSAVKDAIHGRKNGNKGFRSTLYKAKRDLKAPLTQAEQAWIPTACVSLIQRLGRYNAQSLPAETLMLRDLP